MQTNSRWHWRPSGLLPSLSSICVRVQASVSMSVSASVCLPSRFNYSSFPVQIQFGFSICLHVFYDQFLSFVYLLCWGSQCLCGIESSVAVMSLHWCYHYALLQTHRKRCWPRVTVHCGALVCLVSWQWSPESVYGTISLITDRYYSVSVSSMEWLFASKYSSVFTVHHGNS